MCQQKHAMQCCRLKIMRFATDEFCLQPIAFGECELNISSIEEKKKKKKQTTGKWACSKNDGNWFVSMPPTGSNNWSWVFQDPRPHGCEFSCSYFSEVSAKFLWELQSANFVSFFFWFSCVSVGSDSGNNQHGRKSFERSREQWHLVLAQDLTVVRTWRYSLQISTYSIHRPKKKHNREVVILKKKTIKKNLTNDTKIISSPLFRIKLLVTRWCPDAYSQLLSHVWL